MTSPLPPSVLSGQRKTVVHNTVTSKFHKNVHGVADDMQRFLFGLSAPIFGNVFSRGALINIS